MVQLILFFIRSTSEDRTVFGTVSKTDCHFLLFEFVDLKIDNSRSVANTRVPVDRSRVDYLYYIPGVLLILVYW